MDRTLAMVAALVLVGSPVLAHDSPAARIRAIGLELEFDPENAALLLERAGLLRRLEKLEQALADVDLAAGIRGAGDPDVLHERGLVLLDAGRAAEAEAALTALFARRPPGARLFEARARSREAQGKLGPAVRDYSEAVSRAPNPESVLALGRCWERLGELERSVAVYRRGLKSLGGAVVVRLALVDALVRLGRFDRALAQVDQVLAVVPAKAGWRIRRGEVLVAAGRPSQAHAEYQKALAEITERLARRPTKLLEDQRKKAEAGLRSTDSAR